MIRALLVDDEEPARTRLRSMLADAGDVQIVGEAEDGITALRAIPETRPDLVFLDIQMPGLTGLEVASMIAPPRPRIIFCTAYDQYAVQAFEHHAIDYLLKPLTRSRLDHSLENVRRALSGGHELARDVREASATQARLFPRELPRMRGLDFAGVCRSARGVGGDYYDFLSIGPGRLGLVLADVSGKGLYASLLMAGLQARFQSLAPRWGLDIASMLSEINASMHASTEDSKYATLIYAIYEDSSRQLRYANAGHLPPLLIRHPGNALAASAAGRPEPSERRATEEFGGGADGTKVGLMGTRGTSQRKPSLRVSDPPRLIERLAPAPALPGEHGVRVSSDSTPRLIERLAPTGTVIGLLPGASYTQTTVPFLPGDVLLAFTDGVTEARNRSGEEYGAGRLASAAAARADLGASDLCESILREVEVFSGQSVQHDDVTLLVAKAL